jgi:hypothetical protein
MRRLTAFASVLVMAQLCAGCGGSAPRFTGPSISDGNNCGAAYELSSSTVQVATICGGVVGYPPVRVKLRRGEDFRVSSQTNASGKVDFPALLADGDVIHRTSNRGATAGYVATRVGKAVLVSKTRYCERPVNGECVAFVLFVS